MNGCNWRKGNSPESYIPSVKSSVSILEEVFEAWKAEKPTGMIRKSGPAVNVVDESRRPGQKLLGFEILGEVTGNGPRVFAVKLQFDFPKEEKTIRYVLVGIDPLWVFQQSDYDKMVHWEMNHDEASESQPIPKKSS